MYFLYFLLLGLLTTLGYHMASGGLELLHLIDMMKSWGTCSLLVHVCTL